MKAIRHSPLDDWIKLGHAYQVWDYPNMDGFTPQIVEMGIIKKVEDCTYYTCQFARQCSKKVLTLHREEGICALNDGKRRVWTKTGLGHEAY